MKTRSRFGSTAITDHALAAPVFHLAAVPDAEVTADGALGGMGSQLQRSAPVRASNARTTPEGMSTRLLSSIAEPTITRSSITAGGEVMWYHPCGCSPWLRLP